MDKILVATDFSLQSMRLPDCIEDLGNGGIKKVVLVNVLDEEIEEGEEGEERREALSLLSDLRKRLEDKGFEVSVSLTWGKPAVEIHLTAEREKVDFIVLASHGRSYIRRAIWGSTGLEVIRLSNCPVLLERGKTKPSTDDLPARFRKIMVPTDFSLESLSALDVIRNMSKHIGEVVFVHVVEGSRNKKETQDEVAKAQLKLDELVDELTDFGVKASSWIGYGSPAKELIEIAQDIDTSIVILPRISGSIVKNLLMGSTVQAVAIGVDTPVMFVPTEDSR